MSDAPVVVVLFDNVLHLIHNGNVTVVEGTVKITPDPHNPRHFTFSGELDSHVCLSDLALRPNK